MTVQFTDLQALVQGDLDLLPIEVLIKQALQYQDATPEEILDLLEEVAENYAILAPTLAPKLRYSAKKEIEFFVFLYQDSLQKRRYSYQLQESHSSARSLPDCVRAEVDELLDTDKFLTLQIFQIGRSTI